MISIMRPSTPPFALISSAASLAAFVMAIPPMAEFSAITAMRMGSAAWAKGAAAKAAKPKTAARAAYRAFCCEGLGLDMYSSDQAINLSYRFLCLPKLPLHARGVWCRGEGRPLGWPFYSAFRLGFNNPLAARLRSQGFHQPSYRLLKADRVALFGDPLQGCRAELLPKRPIRIEARASRREGGGRIALEQFVPGAPAKLRRQERRDRSGQPVRGGFVHFVGNARGKARRSNEDTRLIIKREKVPNLPQNADTRPGGEGLTHRRIASPCNPELVMRPKQAIEPRHHLGGKPNERIRIGVRGIIEGTHEEKMRALFERARRRPQSQRMAENMHLFGAQNGAKKSRLPGGNGDHCIG